MKGPRHLVAALAVLVSLAALAPAVTSAATSPRKCQSGDLRYPFMPGGPKTFGVFKLRIAGGGCATAHAVAKHWMSRFEAALRAGKLRVPKLVDGYRFTTLPAHAAQTYSERGRKGNMTIWFDYVVPNG
jgi:hypothetical protein